LIFVAGGQSKGFGALREVPAFGDKDTWVPIKQGIIKIRLTGTTSKTNISGYHLLNAIVSKLHKTPPGFNAGHNT
jgi:hypothetical protein